LDKKIYALEVKLNFDHSRKNHLRFFSEKYPAISNIVGWSGRKANNKHTREFKKEIE